MQHLFDCPAPSSFVDLASSNSLITTPKTNCFSDFASSTSGSGGGGGGGGSSSSSNSIDQIISSAAACDSSIQEIIDRNIRNLLSSNQVFNGGSYHKSVRPRLIRRNRTLCRPYSCSMCPYKAKNVQNLKIHERTHTGEKPFVCKVCNMGFSQSQTLRHHTLIHSNEKPFKCPYCEYSCRVNANLSIHIRKHTGERPFICHICASGFAQRSALRNHRRRQHGHYSEDDDGDIIESVLVSTRQPPLLNCDIKDKPTKKRATYNRKSSSKQISKTSQQVSVSSHSVTSTSDILSNHVQSNSLQHANISHHLHSLPNAPSQLGSQASSIFAAAPVMNSFMGAFSNDHQGGCLQSLGMRRN